jgi:cell division protease FtsH
MVCEWGMADEMGPVAYGQEDEPIFIGKEIARHKDYSEDTAKRIDKAVTEILDRGREIARQIIESHKADLEKLAEALIARETLIDDEVRDILGLPPREHSNSLSAPRESSPESSGSESAGPESSKPEQSSPEPSDPEA